MKDKIVYLIIGILIGAIITAACFLAFGKKQTTSDFPKGERPNFEERMNFDENMTPPDGEFNQEQKGNRKQKQDFTTEKETQENTDSSTESNS